MLPASDITEILANLAALNLRPNTVAAVIGAVLAPLLRNSSPDPELERPRKRAGWPRRRPRRATSRRRKKTRARRRVARTTDARERARAALQENPDATVTRIAKLAKCSPSTVCAVRKVLRKEARKTEATPKAAKEPDRHERARQWLRGVLSHGPRAATDVEEAAAKAHVDPLALGQARADLASSPPAPIPAAHTACSGASPPHDRSR